MDDTDYTDEIWKTIPFAPAYQASSLGRIRRAVPTPYNRGVVVLAAATNQGGYRKVKLFNNGRKIHSTVHKCVCHAFHGEPPSPVHVVAHFDGDKLNNRPENLRWATPLENSHDRRRHGTMCLGETHKRSKLTEEAVRDIRSAPKVRRFNIIMAQKYNVSTQTIKRVKTRQNWTHI